MSRTPLWHDRPDAPTSREPAGAKLPERCDVVVVGGGITGLTTALLLGRSGRSVVLVEARSLGAGTTGSSTAKLSLLQGTRLSRIGGRQPAAVVRRYVEANREAQAWVLRFCDTHGIAWQQRPAITYATTAAGERAVRREHRAAVRADLPVELVDDVGLPLPHRLGLRLAEQAQLDPVELVDGLREQAVAHGVTIVEGTRVLRVRHRGDGVTVRTDAGDVGRGVVAMATGMPMLDRGGWFARMTTSRSYSLALQVPEPAVDAMYLSADADTRTLRSAHRDDLGDLLLVGGAGHTTGRTDSHLEHLDRLRDWADTWFPGGVETHAWSAQDHETAHRLPFAGPVVPGQNRVLVAGGFARWGMTGGVAAALALTARITGGRLDWADFLDPWAARAATGAPTVVVQNAAVAAEMASGWLRPLLPGGDARHGDRPRVDYPGLGAPAARSAPSSETEPLSAVCTHLGGVVR